MRQKEIRDIGVVLEQIPFCDVIFRPERFLQIRELHTFVVNRHDDVGSVFGYANIVLHDVTAFQTL
jgi:hypothetical protein